MIAVRQILLVNEFCRLFKKGIGPVICFFILTYIYAYMKQITNPCLRIMNISRSNCHQ